MILKWKVDKIYLYPYGGNTKFNNNLNTLLFEELIILISGPIFQIIYGLLFNIIIKDLKYLYLFNSYHMGILLFNLLPIYPLDGGKLVRIFLEYFYNIKNSFIYTIIISMLIIIILLTKYNSISIYLMICLIIVKIFDELKKYKYYYNNMLLERYLNKNKYNKYKIVSKIDSFYKNRYHIFKINSKYITETTYLKNKYEHK